MGRPAWSFAIVSSSWTQTARPSFAIIRYLIEKDSPLS